MLALERDAALAEPHASLGYVKFYFDWDWPGAEAEFQRAIALDPDWAARINGTASIFSPPVARPRLCDEIKLAREREPLSLAINTDLGFHYYYTGQYDEAIKQLQSVLAMKQDFAPAHLWLGRTFQQVGRFEDALMEFRRVEDRIPEWPVSDGRARVCQLRWSPDQAKSVLAELQQLAKRRFVTAYGVALVYAGIGDREEAFTWLDKAFAERSNWLVWLRLDPRFNSSTPGHLRFTDLLDRMKFPQQVGRNDILNENL